MDSASSDGAAAGVEAFAVQRIVEDDGNVIPFREVYEAYESFAEEWDVEPKAATHFTPALRKHVSVESKPKWHDGETKQCYIGVDLFDDGDLGGEADG